MKTQSKGICIYCVSLKLQVLYFFIFLSSFEDLVTLLNFTLNEAVILKY